MMTPQFNRLFPRTHVDYRHRYYYYYYYYYYLYCNNRQFVDRCINLEYRLIICYTYGGAVCVMTSVYEAACMH